MQEREVIHLPLRDRDELPLPHKTPELQRRVEREVLSQDQTVVDLRRRVPLFYVNTPFKRMLEVMRDEITRFEQEVDVVWRAAFGVVGRADPGRVLGGGPVEFRGDAPAEEGDGGADLGVDGGPLEGGVAGRGGGGGGAGG